MAAKTANVMARVKPEVKERAEAIFTQLGIPASTAINMFTVRLFSGGASRSVRASCPAGRFRATR